MHKRYPPITQKFAPSQRFNKVFQSFGLVNNKEVPERAQSSEERLASETGSRRGTGLEEIARVRTIEQSNLSWAFGSQGSAVGQAKLEYGKSPSYKRAPF